ncbi:MAG: hypothetical protein JW917_08380 [Ignavibacteria bacterium]|nr:hypothetical protein [Ignavibacteria bacterium]
MPKINASDDFINKLQHKINLLDSGEQPIVTKKELKAAAEGKGFWLFKKPLPAWLIPAASIGVVLIIIFSIWMIYKDSPDLPQQPVTEQTSGDKIVTTPPEQSTPETNKTEDISKKDLALDISTEQNRKVETILTSEPRPDLSPKMKEPEDKITIDKEDTKALPPAPSTNEGQKLPESMIREKKVEAKEPEVKKEEEKEVKGADVKKSVNAIKTEKGIDFEDGKSDILKEKPDILKEKTGVMEDKKQKKDGIRSKIDSVKKSFNK